MPLVITSNQPTILTKFQITADAQMPEIIVTAAMQGNGRLPANAMFDWSATLELAKMRAMVASATPISRLKGYPLPNQAGASRLPRSVVASSP